MPQVKCNAQLAVLAAFSTFGDSTVRVHITKLKTFDKRGLDERMPLYRHEYIIRPTIKMFIPEELTHRLDGPNFLTEN
jgi:hypothetical protein